MRSLTVHPSLQGTTTPVCPNVTVTFIIELFTSSNTQTLWLWVINNGSNNTEMLKVVKWASESLDEDQTKMRERNGREEKQK